MVFGIAGLAISIGMTALVDWGPLHLDWLKPDGDDAVTIMFGRLMAAGPFVQVTMVLLLAGLGPLSEEWFFRGWLWTGLRRHWRPVPVMLATALPWLLLHMMNSPLYPLFLGPGGDQSQPGQAVLRRGACVTHAARPEQSDRDGPDHCRAIGGSCLTTRDRGRHRRACASS